MDALEFLEICELTSEIDINENEIDTIFDSDGRFTEKSFSKLGKVFINDEMKRHNCNENSIKPTVFAVPNSGRPNLSLAPKHPKFFVDIHHFTKFGAKQIALRVPNLIPKEIPSTTKFIHGQGNHNNGEPSTRIENVLKDTFKQMDLETKDYRGYKEILN